MSLFATLVQGTCFDNSFNQVSGQEIHSFHLMGERCSGTNFVSQLMNNNFTLNYSHRYGHKHFIPWINPNHLDHRTSFTLDSIGAESYYKDSESCLFIVIVRDPYDWLRSFYKHPYHVSSDLTGSFSTFIHHQWRCTDPDSISLNDNYNPWTNQQFKNVLELRKYKYLNYLNVRNFVKNYLFIRYEDVRDDQIGFLNFLKERYRLNLKDQMRVIDERVSWKKENRKIPFQKKQYFIPLGRDMDWMNNQIDWDLEHVIGYREKTIKELRNPQ